MAADNRGPAISLILDTEAGYTNHKDDPGGPTNLGCTLKTIEAWRGHPCTIEDVKALVRDEAAQIYGVQYADKIMFNDLPRGLDYCVLDAAVNSGPSRAVKLLQQSLGMADEEIDGILGVHTLSAVKEAPPRALIATYCDARLAFMRTLKNWSTFKNGWSARVRGVKQDSLTLADGGDVMRGLKLDELGQAKATGAIKVTATKSGAVALATVGTTLAAAGTAATQASGALSGFSDIPVVRYALLCFACVSALGTLAVAMQRTNSGATT